MPCMCGATDCRHCFPFSWDEPEEPEVEETLVGSTVHIANKYHNASVNKGDAYRRMVYLCIEEKSEDRYIYVEKRLIKKAEKPEPFETLVA